jgi:hypothetical protein
MAKVNGGMNGAGYSTTSEEMLCKTCKFGQVVESAQGGTAVICHYHGREVENATAHRLDMLVTKCSRHELPEVLRLWDTALSLSIEDGHCWMGQTYVPSLGHVHQRADTMGKRVRLYKEFPDREYDSVVNRFVDDPPPVGHGLARWWARLREVGGQSDD